MSRSPTPEAGDREYMVGYGRPPKSSQFKKGQSGNPAGRRKGSKSMATLLNDALSAGVTIKEQGRSRRMTMREVIIRGLVNDAARRDSKAVHQLLALISHYEVATEPEVETRPAAAEDLAILRDFVDRQGGDRDSQDNVVVASPGGAPDEKPTGGSS
jgi:hypothetical protein